MQKSLLKLLFLAFWAIACRPDKDPEPVTPDPPTPPAVDEQYFKAFSSIDPLSEVLFDTLNNLMYVVEYSAGGKIYAYNYHTRELVATTTKSVLTLDYPMAVGQFNGSVEFYLGVEGRLYVYDGSTLALKDTIQVSASNIASIEFQAPNLIFVGLCDGSGSILVFDRTTRQLVTNTYTAGNCIRLRSYKSGTNIELVGVGYATSHPSLDIKTFSPEGALIDQHFDIYPQAGISLHLLKTSDNADYFITTDDGNVFRKSDFSLLKVLAPGHYLRDVVLSPQSDTVYAFSSLAKAEVFDYASGTVVRTKALPQTPQRAVWDSGEGKWIIVYFESPAQPSQLYEKNVFLSKINF